MVVTQFLRGNHRHRLSKNKVVVSSRLADCERVAQAVVPLSAHEHVCALSVCVLCVRVHHDHLGWENCAAWCERAVCVRLLRHKFGFDAPFRINAPSRNALFGPVAPFTARRERAYIM